MPATPPAPRSRWWLLILILLVGSTVALIKFGYLDRRIHYQ